MRIAILFVLASLAGCATNPIMEKAARIKPGTSVDDLRQFMGEPQDRQFRGKNEAWQYCSTGAFADEYVLVWISGGAVSGMQTYRNTTGTGFCESFFRTVNWEHAPDRTIEIRQR